MANKNNISDIKAYNIWLEQVLKCQKQHTRQFLINLNQQLERYNISPKEPFLICKQNQLPEEVFLELVNQAEVLMHPLWALISYYKDQVVHGVGHKNLYALCVYLKTHPLIEDIFSKHSLFCAKGLINIAHAYKDLNQIIRVPGTNSIMSHIYSYDENDLMQCSKSVYEVYPDILTGTNEQHWLGKIADAVCLIGSDSEKVRKRCEIISSLVAQEAFDKLKNQNHYSIMENAAGTGENSMMILKKLEKMGVDLERMHILAMDIDQNSLNEFQKRLNDNQSDYYRFRNCFTLARGNINRLDPRETLNHIQSKYPNYSLNNFTHNGQLSVDTLMQTGIDDYLNLELTFEHPIASNFRTWLQRNVIHMSQKDFQLQPNKKSTRLHYKSFDLFSKLLNYFLVSKNFTCISKTLVFPNFSSRAHLVKKDGFYVSAVFSKEDYDHELSELSQIIKGLDGSAALDKIRSLCVHKPKTNQLDNPFKTVSSNGGRISCMLWFLNYQYSDDMHSMLSQAGLSTLTESELHHKLADFRDQIKSSSLEKKSIHMSEGLHIFAMRKAI